MTEDSELLRQFAEVGSQEAFAELVRRRIDFVYASAMRLVAGDAHLADEVTQAVFLALALQAKTLPRGPILSGWLHTTTRFIAAKAVRTHRRWKSRELEANNMITERAGGEPQWNELSPVLDEVLGELEAPDRDAILLRFFEGQPYAGVAAKLGLQENSARMRVERALEKLRLQLGRRGITSTGAALATALAQQPILSAPAGLAGFIIQSAITGAGVSGGAVATGLLIMNTTKVVTIAGLVALAAGVGFYSGTRQASPVESVDEPAARLRDQLTRLRTENRSLSAEVDQLRATRPAGSVGAAAAPSPPPPTFSLIPEKIDAPMPESAKISAVQNNLRVLSAAAKQYRLEKGVDPTFEQLVGSEPGKFIKAIKAVDSEDYSSIDFAANASMAVTLPNGATVKYEPTGSIITRSGSAVAMQRANEAFLAANGRPAPQGSAELLPYIDLPEARAEYVARVGQMQMMQQFGPDFQAKVEIPAKVYAAAYKAAYGMDPPTSMQAFRNIASYLQSESDRARFLEAWEKANAETARLSQ